MARVIAEFPGNSSGRPTKYPWNDWLNGQVWELIPGEDFHVSPSGLRSAMARQAKLRGLKVRTRLVGDPTIAESTAGCLVVQAYTPDPETE